MSTPHSNVKTVALIDYNIPWHSMIYTKGDNNFCLENNPCVNF